MDLGYKTFLNEVTGPVNVYQWDTPTKVKVGAYCSLEGPISIFVNNAHKHSHSSTYPFCEKDKMDCAKTHYADGVPQIGNDVHIAPGCTIMGGITIGDGAIITAGSVVNKTVPPYSIVAGNPAKVLDYRFPLNTIQRYLAVKWWDFDPKIVEKYLVPNLDNPNLWLEIAENIRAELNMLPVKDELLYLF